ncbi:MAG: hypothetical protein AB7K24_30125 [Gemmataceae bacterium]
MSASDKTFEWYGGYPVQSETGVDLTLLRANLDRTQEQRLERHGQAFRFAQELRKSGGLIVAESRPTKDLNARGLIELLTRNGVEFVLIGGLAMTVHGSAHITYDFDIVYKRSAENIDALVNALVAINAYLRGVPPGLPFHIDSRTIQAGLNFTFVTDMGDVDVLGEISGVGNWEKVVSSSEVRTLYDVPVRVLSVDGLIAAKKAAGRIKDQLHLLELEELKKMRDEGQQPG